MKRGRMGWMISLLMSLRKLTTPSKRTFILVFASVR
jgi:hypothetical protein